MGKIIIAQYELETLEHKERPLPHHMLGLQYTASGYGNKIPTSRMVRLPGSARWRRVYCCIHSNAGTCYVMSPAGNWIVIY